MQNIVEISMSIDDDMIVDMLEKLNPSHLHKLILFIFRRVISGSRNRYILPLWWFVIVLKGSINIVLILTYLIYLILIQLRISFFV